MLVVNEVFLRVYFYGALARISNQERQTIPHPTRGYTLNPGSRTWHQELDFTVPINVNSQGLRGPEISPKGSKQRILLIGDSTTYGSGVPEDQIIPALLAKELNPALVDVVNGSFTTYNTVQELLFLLEEGLAFEPDLVILAFSPNTDIQANTIPLQSLYQKKKRRPYASLDENGALQINLTYVQKFYEKQTTHPQKKKEPSFLKSQVTYQLVKKYVKSFKTSVWNDPNIFIGWPFLQEFSPEYSTRGLSREEYQQLWLEGWNVTKALLSKMREASVENGAKFAMMVMAPKLQVETKYQAKVLEVFPHLKLDVTRINREFESFGKESGIPVLDALTPLLGKQKIGETGLYFNMEDEHMTAKSHALVASALAQQILQKGLIQRDL
jgi:lysophospholipase L1-like esterase